MVIAHCESIVWWSLKQIIALLFMPKCPMPNHQWPFAKASFIELRVKATPEGMLLRRFSLKSGINFAHFSLESGMF